MIVLIIVNSTKFGRVMRSSWTGGARLARRMVMTGGTLVELGKQDQHNDQRVQKRSSPIFPNSDSHDTNELISYCNTKLMRRF
jgi:hypothetical protein